MFNPLPFRAADIVMKAQLETLPADEADRRGQARQRVRLTLLASTAARPHPDGIGVDVLNLSATGLLFRTSGMLALDEEILVVVGDGVGQRAAIVWCADDLYGCRFAVPLDRAAVSALLLRSEPIGSAEPRPIAPARTSTFGTRLREARQRSGHSMVALARAIGVSKPTVWKWETDRVRPRPAAMRKLCAALHVTEADLLVDPDSSAPARGSAADGDGITLAEMIGSYRTRISQAAGVSRERVAIDIDWE